MSEFEEMNYQPLISIFGIPGISFELAREAWLKHVPEKNTVLSRNFQCILAMARAIITKDCSFFEGFPMYVCSDNFPWSEMGVMMDEIK